MTANWPYKRQKEISAQTGHKLGCDCQTCKWTAVSLAAENVERIFSSGLFGIFRCKP